MALMSLGNDLQGIHSYSYVRVLLYRNGKLSHSFDEPRRPADERANVLVVGHDGAEAVAEQRVAELEAEAGFALERQQVRSGLPREMLVQQAVNRSQANVVSKSCY
jgi:hypothetical protein